MDTETNNVSHLPHDLQASSVDAAGTAGYQWGRGWGEEYANFAGGDSYGLGPNQ